MDGGNHSTGCSIKVTVRNIYPRSIFPKLHADEKIRRRNEEVVSAIKQDVLQLTGFISLASSKNFFLNTIACNRGSIRGILLSCKDDKRYYCKYLVPSLVNYRLTLF